MKWTMRLSLLATAAVLAVSLAGCGGTDQPDSPSDTPTTTTTEKITLTTAPAADSTKAQPEKTEPSANPTEPPANPTKPAGNSTGTPTPTKEPDNKPDKPADKPSETPTGNGAAVAKLAATLEGAPFVYGAAGPDSFDNSGLVYYCLTQNGISVPRRTTAQFAGGTAVEADALQPGDLVFYWMETEGSAQYVGIYLGDGAFIAANNEEKPACLYKTSMKYFTDRFVGARRYA